MAILEIYGELPKDAACYKCDCSDKYDDLIPTEGGDYICCECMSREEWREQEDNQENGD